MYKSQRQNDGKTRKFNTNYYDIIPTITHPFGGEEKATKTDDT